MPKTTTPRFYRRKIFVVFSIVMLLVAASLTGLAIWRYENNKAIAADRARFEQTAQDVQTIANSLKKASPPESVSLHKNCTYQSREWSQKPVVCDVVYKAVYGVNSLAEANVILGSQYNILQSRNELSKFGKQSFDNKTGFTSYPENENEYSLGEAYKNISTGLDCTSAYELYNTNSPPPYNKNEVSRTGTLSMLVMLDCSGLAKSAHYPIVK